MHDTDIIVCKVCRKPWDHWHATHRARLHLWAHHTTSSGNFDKIKAGKEYRIGKWHIKRED